MAVTQLLDWFQRKHPWAGFPLAVTYKYFDDFGAYRRSYSGQAQAQRSKDFEHIDVTFDPPSPEPGKDDPGP